LPKRALIPLLRYWQIFDINGLDPEGEQARQDLAEILEAQDARAARFAERRELSTIRYTELNGS